jgi:hypothetical protein
MMVRSERVTGISEALMEVLYSVDEPTTVSEEVSGRSAVVPLQVRSTESETATGPAAKLHIAMIRTFKIE